MKIKNDYQTAKKYINSALENAKVIYIAYVSDKTHIKLNITHSVDYMKMITQFAAYFL